MKNTIQAVLFASLAALAGGAVAQTIKIGEVEYIRKDALPDTEGDIKIVVLDRGFVYVGHVSSDADFVVIDAVDAIDRPR